MTKIFGILVACLLVSGDCLAHQDRIITILQDGTLEGIPPEYGPARLRIEFAPPKAGGAPITAIDVTLSTNSVHLPLCVTGLLHTERMDTIRASASWYHDEKLLPYYLEIDFFDPGYNPAQYANPGFSMLFNLRTGKLMRMEAQVVRDGGKTVQQVPVDVAERCKWRPVGAFFSPER